MILFIDTETTGKYLFDRAPGESGQPYIVQLAAIMYDDQRRERFMLNTLIRPTRGGVPFSIPVDAQAIHGISTQDCQRSGLTIHTAMTALEQLCDMSEVVVAHNIDFDAAMVTSEIVRLGRVLPPALRRRYCTMKESTHICNLPGKYGPKWPKLSEAYQFFFKEELQGAHDALADVRACARIYYALQDRHAAAMSCAGDERDQT